MIKEHFELVSNTVAAMQGAIQRAAKSKYAKISQS
jgi:hypothetical protein